MKSLLLFSSLLLISLIACNQNPTSNQTDSEIIDSLALSTVTLHVEGMTCEGCENTVSSSLLNLDGVLQATASHIDSTTIVVFDANLISIDLISEKITDVGYSVIEEVAIN